MEMLVHRSTTTAPHFSAILVLAIYSKMCQFSGNYMTWNNAIIIFQIVMHSYLTVGVKLKKCKMERFICERLKCLHMELLMV